MSILSFSQIGDVDLGIPPEVQGDLWLYQKLDYQYPMHHHRELELILALRGTGAYLLGNRRYTMRPDSVVWLFPGQDHILLEESDDFTMWEAVFKPELMHGVCRTAVTATLLESNPEGDFCRALSAADAEDLGTLFAALHARKQETDYFNAGLGFLLLTAWSMYQRSEPVTAGSPLHPAVKQAVRLISEETTPLSLESIAARVGLCPSRLSLLFRQEIGTSLLHFRDRQRVERFLRLRKTRPDRTLLETALAAGFGSYAQFHRVFRDITGVSPSRFTE